MVDRLQPLPLAFGMRIGIAIIVGVCALALASLSVAVWLATSGNEMLSLAAGVELSLQL